MAKRKGSRGWWTGQLSAAPGDSHATDQEAACTPSCDKKECGPDGCGGTCGSCVAPSDLCKAAICDNETRQCLVIDTQDGTPCDDGEPCHVDSFCQAGDGLAGEVLDCDDGLACRDDQCGGAAGRLHMDT